MYLLNISDLPKPAELRHLYPSVPIPNARIPLPDYFPTALIASSESFSVLKLNYMSLKSYISRESGLFCKQLKTRLQSSVNRAKTAPVANYKH